MGLGLTQVAQGVHRLDSVYTNWYLLEAGGRLTVLDAGLPLRNDGAVFVRGDVGPLRPYIPSGAYL